MKESNTIIWRFVDSCGNKKSHRVLSDGMKYDRKNITNPV